MNRWMRFATLVAWVGAVLTGCGQYHTTYVKDYRLYFATEDNRLKSEGRRLIQVYNQRLGENVLSFAANPNEANSHVRFNRGMRDYEGKLGLGQWESNVNEEPDFRRIEGRPLERKIEYSMNIAFDEDFTLERSGMSEQNAEWQRLFLLFCHEVGHGMQLDHVDDEHNVMYPVIKSADSVNFDAYFAKIREYLKTQ